MKGIIPFNGSTSLGHPKSVARDVSRCHALAGVGKGEAKRGYTSLSGAIETMGGLIAAVVGVASVTLTTPGRSAYNALSRLATMGAWQALISSHSGKI